MWLAAIGVHVWQGLPLGLGKHSSDCMLGYVEDEACLQTQHQKELHCCSSGSASALVSAA